LKEGKKIYFASDFHLGVPDKKSSLIREKKIIRWLNQVSEDAEEIWLLGDIFDFWFDYKKVVPRGFVRLLGKMADIVDSGIPITIITGNHDMWFFDYLPEEIGVTLYREPVSRTWAGKKFLIGHGDGLGPGDKGYKLIKKVFSNKICQWLFRWIHPDIGIGMADYFSSKSRASTEDYDKIYLGDENEWLAIYAKDVLKSEHYDYFIFGHRHLPIDIEVGENSRYINLGEWINYYTYAVFDGRELKLLTFESDQAND
jgi:UDP-2,3-diacylglucosamine hydrolase